MSRDREPVGARADDRDVEALRHVDETPAAAGARKIEWPQI
jgi:hypothetical protein